MAATSGPTARHVVLVLVDAMRADRLGAYGGQAGTPTMDGLARRGVVFANACAQAPSTRPSVSSLMTGLYPSQHGIVDRIVSKTRREVTVAGLDASLPMLAQVLADAGVTTAAFLGGNANVKPVFGLTRGFGHVEWRPTTDGTVLVGDFAAWANAGHAGPTFSYLHFMDVHHPLPMEIIPGRLDDGIDVDTTDRSIEELVDCYDDAVALVDRHIGHVLNALGAAGMRSDAMVVVTADHGEELLEHGAMLAHGRTLYRELVHVPLLMCLPGDEYAGTVDRSPVQLIDLFPTVLNALGQPPVALPGRSLLASLGAGYIASDRPAFSELHRRDHYSQSVTTATHQLVVTYVFAEGGACLAQDIQPGARVRVKGQPVRGGRFLATKIGLSANRVTKMRGTLEEVDTRGGNAKMLGVRFAIDPNATWTDLYDCAHPLTTLVAGTRLSVHLGSPGADGWTAVGAAERKPGGKSKLEGPVESVVRDAEMLVLRVLGVDVEVPPDMHVLGRSGEARAHHDKAGALQRMLSAEFVDRRVELFELAGDPHQRRSIVDERPDLAQELEGQLAAWTEWMSSRVTSADASVDVDPETLDQLRRMGYLE